jgi:hypothetical protein
LIFYPKLPKCQLVDSMALVNLNIWMGFRDRSPHFARDDEVNSPFGWALVHPLCWIVGLVGVGVTPHFLVECAKEPHSTLRTHQKEWIRRPDCAVQSGFTRSSKSARFNLR